MKTNEFDPEARTDQQALTQRVRAALDASVDELDGATLSRLNQARHHALENARRGWRQRVWLVATA